MLLRAFPSFGVDSTNPNLSSSSGHPCHETAALSGHTRAQDSVLHLRRPPRLRQFRLDLQILTPTTPRCLLSEVYQTCGSAYSQIPLLQTTGISNYDTLRRKQTRNPTWLSLKETSPAQYLLILPTLSPMCTSQHTFRLLGPLIGTRFSSST